MQPTIDTKLGNPNFSGVTTDSSYGTGTATVKPPAMEVKQNTPTPNFPTFNPSQPVPSSALTSGLTVQDVLSERRRLADELAKSQIASQREQELAQRIKEIETGSTTAQLGLEGQGRGITQDILSKQGAAIQRRETIAKLPLVNELNTLVSQRSSQIDAVKSQLDLTTQNLNILTELQKMTQPDIVGNPIVDKTTGTISALMRNPQTGQIMQQTIGSVGVEEAQKQFVQTGTYTNAQNERVFYGVTPDGRIEQQVLGGEQLPASLVPKPGVEGTPLSTTQVNTFNRFAEKLNSSEAIKALDRANNLQNIVAAVKQNPAGASNQLALIYSYIKGLDTDSAVREGEIDLVQSIQPYLRKYQTAFERVTNGKLINEKTALEIANGAETVINSIRSTARNKIASFDEQARRNGTNFYNEWTQYTQSVTPLLMPSQTQSGKPPLDTFMAGTNNSTTTKPPLSSFFK